MWGLIPAQTSHGADPYRDALHKKGAEPPVPTQPVTGDLPSSLLSLDDLLPGGRVDILMIRPSVSEPWGFQVEEGTEQHYSLVVQKVTGGSLADGQQLMRGDVITAVNGCDVTDMTHSQALQLINQAGLELTLTLDPQPVPFPTHQVPKPNLNKPLPIQQQQATQLGQKPQYEEQQQQQQLQQLQQQPEKTERRSRVRAQDNQTYDYEENVSGLRSRSSGSNARGHSDYPAPTWLTEPGWTPRAKPVGSKGSDSGWRIRSKPQAVARASAYPSTGEMGWSPKPRSANSPQYKSNPALNEYGWTARARNEPTSAFTRVISNGPATGHAVHQRQRDQQRQPEHQREYKQQHKQQQQQQQLNELPDIVGQPQGQYQAEIQQQAGINMQQQDTVEQQQQQEEQRLAATQSNQQQQQQQQVIPDQLINVQQQPTEVQTYEPQQQSYQQQQIYPGQLQQQQQQYNLQSPYTSKTDFYETRRNRQKRAGVDEDMEEGMPAWYGSLRPAGGRYGRWDSSSQGTGSPSTRGQDSQVDSGWIPHGLDRETRMIQAQTVHATTMPYHPPIRLANQQIAAQQQLNDSGSQEYEIQQEYQQQQQQQQQLPDDSEPHWTAYPKKQHRSQVEAAGIVRVGGRSEGRDDKFKSEIQNIHLVTTTWTQSGTQRSQTLEQMMPSSVPQPQQQLYQQKSQPGYAPEILKPQTRIATEKMEDALPRLIQQSQQIQAAAVQQSQQTQAAVTNQSQQAHAAAVQQSQQAQAAAQVQPQTPRVPQQFYSAGNQQQPVAGAPSAASQQSAIAHGQHPATAVPWTRSSSLSRTVSSAFIDFYVQESANRGDIHSAVQKDCKVQVFQGGFVDFYVIAGGAVKFAEMPTSSAPATPAQVKETEAIKQTSIAAPVVAAASAAGGKTRTGGFIDFYVLSQNGPTDSKLAEVGQTTGTQSSVEKVTTTAVQSTVTEQGKGKTTNGEIPDANKSTVASETGKPFAVAATGNTPGKEVTTINNKPLVGKEEAVKQKEINGKASGGIPSTVAGAKAAGAQVGKLKMQGVQPKPETQKLSTPAAFRGQLKPTKALPGKLK